MTESTTPREPGEEGRREHGPPPPLPPQGTMGLPESTACGLSYVAIIVTGAVFYVLDQRPEVRFHAMQSILFGAAWLVVGALRSAIDIFPIGLVLNLAWLVGLATWIILMIQGFQGRHLKLPLIGDLAEQQARHTS